MSKTPEKIAIYGKGGVGKSVVATALSASCAIAGHRVLHIGCDPKHDSAIRLLDGQREIRTVLDALGDDSSATSADILHRGRHSIDCCESGGPPAGMGCGGRGVARTLEHIEELGLLRSGLYDVAIFDVLGDVVCGGFAAPLRDGFAQKIVIVASEEPMALYAANNIARAVVAYQRNGVGLAGLLLNLRSPTGDRALVQRFSDRLGTVILETMERDEFVIDAERRGRTIVEHAPESNSAGAMRRLAARLLEIRVTELPAPRPMSDAEFFDFIRAI